ncbi:hypothetical protein [Thalassoglobus polymorphus]|nr:hypothetical protein [Thalassoglobus polymorphus]
MLIKHRMLFVALLLFGVLTGCGTISRQQDPGCDCVVNADFQAGSIELSPQLGDEGFTLVPIPLEEYDESPRACRRIEDSTDPSINSNVAQVKWKSNSSEMKSDQTSKPPRTIAKPISQSQSVRSSTSSISTSNRTLTFIPPDPAHCLPLLTDLKQKTESKSAELEQQLSGLEKIIQENDRALKEMAEALKLSNNRIENLKSDVDKYRSDLLNLESSIERQHVEDLKILDSLSNQLGNLLNDSSPSVR